MSSPMDNVLREAGGVGPYQVLHTILLGSASRFVYLWETLNIVYAGRSVTLLGTPSKLVYLQQTLNSTFP